MCQTHSCNCNLNTCGGCNATTPYSHEKEKHVVRILSRTDKVELHYDTEKRISNCYFEEPARIFYNNCTLYRIKSFGIVNDKIYFFGEYNSDSPIIDFKIDNKIITIYETSEKNLFVLESDLNIEEYDMSKEEEMNYFPKYSISINKIPKEGINKNVYEAIIKVKVAKFEEEVIIARTIVDTVIQAINNVSYFYNDTTGITNILQNISNGKIKYIFYNNDLCEILCLRDYGIEVKDINERYLLLPYYLLSRAECIIMTKDDYIIIDNKLYNGLEEIESSENIINNIKRMNELQNILDSNDEDLEVEETEWFNLHNKVVDEIGSFNPTIKEKSNILIYVVDGRNKYCITLNINNFNKSDKVLFEDDKIAE